ncbi:hypothetical protein HY523_01425 [Candidatus Berkelbacteria bacterium]|nr:hypothetical protein [Candidatus Berkelbacteria bacterium]
MDPVEQEPTEVDLPDELWVCPVCHHKNFVTVRICDHCDEGYRPIPLS